MAQVKQREKVALRREKGALHQRKLSYQVVKGTKSPKTKCFEENGAVQNAIKNRTTKNWVEEDLSKFPIKTPPTKHQCGETLRDLEPVYDLFTIMGEIIPSESLSRVTYTGINSMHSQKTKPPYIQGTRNNRTRKKKSAVEEDRRKRPEKIKKIQPLEKLKSTESGSHRKNSWVDKALKTSVLKRIQLYGTLKRTQPLTPEQKKT